MTSEHSLALSLKAARLGVEEDLLLEEESFLERGEGEEQGGL
jgi:hypothetical protein